MKKSIIGILSAAGGAVAGILAIGKTLNKKVQREHGLAEKHLKLFMMMDQWVKVKQDNKSLSAYFEKEGYQEIAIYGMHFAGETLVEELFGSDIKIKYGIDKNADSICADFNIVTPDSHLEEVDVIVVTAITFFEEIREKLREKVSCPIVSLEEIIYQV